MAVALAAPAQAGIVSAEDAAELAQTLAEAQEEQDVCYGWNVTNNFSDSNDVGSSRSGPGVALVPAQSACPKGAVILQGDIDYACSSCDSSDSASVSIASSLRDPPTVSDLEALGLKAGALTGDDDDTTLINMVEALPLIVADRGNAPYVEYEQTKTVPAADHATGKPGSDVLRDTWIQLVLFGGLILAGPGFFLYKRAQRPSPPQEHDVQYVPAYERSDQPEPPSATAERLLRAAEPPAGGDPPSAPEPEPPSEPSRRASAIRTPSNPNLPLQPKDSGMDYWEDLATELGSGLLYGLVGIVLLALGFRMMDLLTPGHLGRQLCEDRNRNAGVIVSAAMLSIGIIVTSAIIASDGDLAKGLGQSAGFGLLGIGLLGVAFVVVDLLTPGKLGDILMGDEHEPMVYVTGAALLSIGGIVAAAIS